MANKPNKYIAIDSDILRELAFFDILKKEYEHVDIEQIPPNRSLKRDFNYFIRLYNCILYEDIKIVIVDAVYQESKHSPHLVNFIKEHCYFPNINTANYQEKAEKARQLANAYCSEYTYKGATKPAPMKSVFVAAINQYVPTNDCFIMAQATIEGLPLLTGNGQDFIFNVKNENRNEHDRVKGITRINIINGYSKTNSKGFEVTSAPILIFDLVPILKNARNFQTPKTASHWAEWMVWGVINGF